jgi:hypothetical protein
MQPSLRSCQPGKKSRRPHPRGIATCDGLVDEDVGSPRSHYDPFAYEMFSCDLLRDWKKEFYLGVCRNEYRSDILGVVDQRKGLTKEVTEFANFGDCFCFRFPTRKEIASWKGILVTSKLDWRKGEQNSASIASRVDPFSAPISLDLDGMQEYSGLCLFMIIMTCSLVRYHYGKRATSVLLYIEESWPPDAALEKIPPYMPSSAQRAHALYVSYRCRQESIVHEASVPTNDEPRSSNHLTGTLANSKNPDTYTVSHIL